LDFRKKWENNIAKLYRDSIKSGHNEGAIMRHRSAQHGLKGKATGDARNERSERKVHHGGRHRDRVETGGANGKGQGKKRRDVEN